jgi:hypothetical protein
MGRTMRDIAARYDARREEILQLIEDRRASASMSGIEYYPKPWAELDMSNPDDAYVISSNLTWDEAKQQHDYEGLRRSTAADLEARSRGEER